MESRRKPIFSALSAGLLLGILASCVSGGVGGGGEVGEPAAGKTPGANSNYAVVPSQEAGVVATGVEIGEPIATVKTWVSQQGVGVNAEGFIQVKLSGRLLQFDGCPILGTAENRVVRIYEPSRKQVLDSRVQADHTFEAVLEVLPASVDLPNEKPLSWIFYLSPKDFSGTFFETPKYCSASDSNCAQLNSEWSPLFAPLTANLQCWTAGEIDPEGIVEEGIWQRPGSIMLTPD